MEFNKMKSDLAGMRSERSIAKSENAMFRARLTGAPVQARDEKLARTDLIQQKEMRTWKS
jgi:hypothetical protein